MPVSPAETLDGFEVVQKVGITNPQLLENALALLRDTTYSVAGRADTAAAEHQAIIEAICSRDAQAAELAARKHISAAQRARLRLMLEEEEQ